MRIWDLPAGELCRSHLLGEHRELHAVWSILTQGKRGYANHPETRRWRGRLKALYLRHEGQVQEMSRRGYLHRSPLAIQLATGDDRQVEQLDSNEEQVTMLRAKGCGCCPRTERRT